MTLYCSCSWQQYRLQLSELSESWAACGTAQTESLYRYTTDHGSANSTSNARTRTSEGNTGTNCSYRHIQHKWQGRLFAVHQVVSQHAVNEVHLNIRICTHATACATLHIDCSTVCRVYPLETSALEFRAPQPSTVTVGAPMDGMRLLKKGPSKRGGSNL